jgi:pimeloyl-ACP methyl ester carboxylesterase
LPSGVIEQKGQIMTTQDIDIRHGMAALDPGVTLRHVAAGDGDRTIVLLHGFPQTWREWRQVLPRLVGAGYRVIAPDYRGAGHSSRPLGGYDKRTMAADIRRLVKDELGVAGPIVLVGHDIGLMVAYAYAQMFRDDVSHLAVIDAPLPGTQVFDRLRADPRVWQFAFHSVRDIPEMLIAGRERAYLQAFFNARLYNVAAITDQELDAYVSAYSAAGALRAGFELYRAFDRDIDDNHQWLTAHGKLTIPVLAVGGQASTTGPLMAEMMREVADDVTELRVPNAAHWIAEENPRALVDGLVAFLAEGARGQ